MSDVYDFVEMIKEIAISAVKAADPMSTEFAEVVSAKPLKLSMGSYTVSEKEELFVITRRIKELIDGKKLKPGDCVLVLKEDGGENWIILDAVEVTDE